MLFSLRIALVTIILSLTQFGCASHTHHTNHTNLAAGIRSFRVQDYRKAFVRLKKEAKRGQPDAQYAVGYMYYYGQGVIEDRKRAWYWIRKAARAGQPDAVAAVAILQQQPHTIFS
ncbi:Sel-1 protein [Legionella lansingensis]|uniref:Sel-1 protein n=1 Tax=Legionella lansingensis TaxID=45067 RepID=A0A0W0VEL3_9GAMM|nr:tetratricopeptide repeat protein [Legionella lansingensis]KTD18581.1 Sel-1 protein [Legionella lansingensis]SNV49340.1 Sel-1 protein [Legionella lansingensis]